jgi:PadR family transcriptional regulator PadR
MSDTPYLGELEELTLLALLRQEEGATGGDVRGELARGAERRVSPSTVYLTLMRLEEKGLCQSWMGEPEPVAGGKARRRYRIVRAGVTALERSREIRSRMWEGFDILAERALGRG